MWCINENTILKNYVNSTFKGKMQLSQAFSHIRSYLVRDTVIIDIILIEHFLL